MDVWNESYILIVFMPVIFILNDQELNRQISCDGGLHLISVL